MTQLADGSVVSLETVPADALFAGWTAGTTASVIAANTRLTLALKQRERLAESAALAGAALPDAPFLLHLALAYTAQCAHLPDQRVLTVLTGVAESVGAQIVPSTTIFPRGDIRVLAIDSLRTAATGIAIPEGRWNAARALLAIGVQAWHLTSDDAAWWGSVPTIWATNADAATEWQRMLLAHLAGLTATPAILRSLSATTAPEATPADVWIDWISLVGGPGVPPSALRPAGLGAGGDSLLETADGLQGLELSARTGVILDQLAATLLATASRPIPRSIGRLMDVAIPADLVPQLAAWGIATLRVQAHPAGLWFAALDATDRSLGAAWWRAAAATSTRAPLSFPPATWSLVHPVLAGLWHDLCADAIIVDAPQAPVKPRAVRGTDERRATRPTIVLPPVRAARATWADAMDRQALARARQVGSGYRRLPTGWEDRATSRDFRQRQERATARAASYHSPAPPPGFTFVKPFVVGLSENLPISDVPQIRSRGLFSLLLGLADLAEATEHEDAR